MITWRYIKPLVSTDSIDEFSKKFDFNFDDAYLSCVMQNNGGRPSCSTYDTDKVKERTIKSLLSFNKNDLENIFKSNEILRSEILNVIAFAIDNFGNFICFSKENGAIIFYDFESEKVEFIANDFSDFLSRLYQ